MRSKFCHEIQEILKRASDLKILDVGIGEGLTVLSMPNTLQDIVGLDPSKKMLDVLKRNAELSGRNILCIRGVGELIPLRDSCFNMILCKDVLDHICSLPQLFHEFIRTLSCGGLLLVAQSIPDFKMIDDTHTILLSERLIIRYLEDEFTLIKHVRLNGPFLRLMVRLLPIITKHAIVLLTKIDQISIRLAKHASYHIFISKKSSNQIRTKYSVLNLKNS
jgi:ubiquinone/menaquinone biosynthesis C-methylase UbiE